MWNDNLCICSRSSYCFFKIIYQFFLFLSQLNIERLFHYNTIVGGLINSVLEMLRDSSILTYNVVIFIEHETQLAGLAICHCW